MGSHQKGEVYKKGKFTMSLISVEQLLKEADRLEQKELFEQEITLLNDFLCKNKGKDSSLLTDLYIRLLYILVHIVIDGIKMRHYDFNDRSKMFNTHFSKSFKLYEENAEYLFYIGNLLYMSEDYVYYDVKQIEQILNLAYTLDNSILYKWGELNSKSKLRESSRLLAQEILLMHDDVLINLKKKGLAGKYILNQLLTSSIKHK